MSLLTLEYVKGEFPTWENWCPPKKTRLTTVDVLQKCITNAEVSFLEYVPSVTAENITDPLKLHLMAFIRYACFSWRHDTTKFESKPLIVREYEDSRKQLMRYQKGELVAPGTEATAGPMRVVNTKSRRFGSGWFV